MTNPPKKSLPPQRWQASASVFFVRKTPNPMPSAASPLRCASLRAFPPAAPPHPPGKPPFFLNRFPLPSVARLRGALLGGASAPGLLAPLVLCVPLSLRCRSLRSPALRAGGWCCFCAASWRFCSWLPSVALLPCPSGWRSSLPPGSRLVAPARSVAYAPFPLVAPCRARGCVACRCAAALLARTAA